MWVVGHQIPSEVLPKVGFTFSPKQAYDTVKLQPN